MFYLFVQSSQRLFVLFLNETQSFDFNRAYRSIVNFLREVENYVINERFGRFLYSNLVSFVQFEPLFGLVTMSIAPFELDSISVWFKVEFTRNFLHAGVVEVVDGVKF